MTSQIDGGGAAAEPRHDHSALSPRQVDMRELEGSLISAISHDVAEPMLTARAFADEMYRRATDDEIKDFSRRISVNTMLAQRRLDAAVASLRLLRQPIERQRIDMNALVSASAKMHVPVRASIEIGPLPDTSGDPPLVSALVGALLENAVEATEPDQPLSIVVAGEVSGGVPTYFVRDDGPGVEIENVERLFDMFVRLHADPMRLGTGLTMARIIVTLHDGGIGCGERSPHGFEVVFTLPDPAFN